MPKNKTGFKYVLILVKPFTHCVIEKATEAQTADIAISFFQTEIMRQFGSQSVVWPDQRPAFISAA